jgi:hypothetical protein
MQMVLFLCAISTYWYKCSLLSKYTPRSGRLFVVKTTNGMLRAVGAACWFVFCIN